VATVVSTNAVDTLNKVRRALSIGGPTFIHSLNPCPKGWDYDPKYSYEIGELAVETGIWPLYEVEDHKLKMYGKSKHIASGAAERKPVREYLMRQGRFAHFIEEDIAYFQAKTDEMWNEWLLPGVLPFAKP
jgi:pyruvate ferredoxin oxidoreductase beta subunit